HSQDQRFVAGTHTLSKSVMQRMRMIMRYATHPLHYSYRTEQIYIYWIRFIFSVMRRPREIGKPEQVIEVEMEWIDDVVQTKRPIRVPVVLTRDERSAILRRMSGRYWLMAIMYGRGLRVAECLGQIDTQVLQRGGGAVRSPVDALLGSGACPDGPACTARPSFFAPSP
ncbi:MAG: hypothetical protein ACLFTM_10755, partial [Ectothiorhodospira sp.]